MAERDLINEEAVEPSEGTKDANKIPPELPLLPVRDVVVYPFMILPLFVGREKSIKAVDEALSKNRMIFLVAQKDAESEDPKAAELFPVGTVAIIMRMLKLPDGRVKILVQGMSRARLGETVQNSPFFLARIQEIEEPEFTPGSLEVEAMMRTVKEQLGKVVSLGKPILPDIVVLANNLEHPGRLADLVASNIDLKIDQAQVILETVHPVERLKAVSDLLNKEAEILEVQQKIQIQAKEEMDKSHREYVLREQLKAIHKELGDTDEHAQEINELAEKIEKAQMPETVTVEAKKQLSRLEKMHPDAAEASVVRTYLEWLLDLPWSKETKDNLNIRRARKILDEDHYDLEKVKERILEYLSVRKLKKKMKGPILCFVGPPGVGKTSLGKSIARALGRQFVRISLGGMRDEAEIRGHRRTYIGALPGRIIQGMKTAGFNNPVFMMDEVDKIGMDFRGDPSAALLEVLDPEQNNSFSDHYLGVPFDLSNVMFITTANLIDPIPPALKDRMEIINLPGYTEEEKLKIANKYLVPRQMEENGIGKRYIGFTDDAVLKIILEYTREAGLRNLEREIATICRKVARGVAEGKRKPLKISARNIHKYIGAPKFLSEEEQKMDEIGLATGLAWTMTGGDIIYIEATVMKGKGNLILTGHLGDVMKESAQAAYSYARSRAKELGIPQDFHANNDIHIHVPAGAIPKDGPSAGITMATALVSALAKIPVRREVAMTGEVTLRGKVLPIGGIKEKILAARRAGIKTVIVPKRNDKDIDELPPTVKRGMKFVLVEEMEEVIKEALIIEEVPTPRGRQRRRPETSRRTSAPQPAVV